MASTSATRCVIAGATGSPSAASAAGRSRARLVCGRSFEGTSEMRGFRPSRRARASWAVATACLAAHRSRGLGVTGTKTRSARRAATKAGSDNSGGQSITTSVACAAWASCSRAVLNWGAPASAWSGWTAIGSRASAVPPAAVPCCAHWVAERWGSASMSTIRCPCSARVAARFRAMVVLPTPPFRLMTLMICTGAAPRGLGSLAADSIDENSETRIHKFTEIRLSLFPYFLTYIYLGVWLAPAPRPAGPLTDARQTGSSGRALRREGAWLAGLRRGQVLKAGDPDHPLRKRGRDLQSAAHGLDEAAQRADVQIRPAFELGETRRRALPNRRQVRVGPVPGLLEFLERHRGQHGLHLLLCSRLGVGGHLLP